jgi:hypothetical protein
MDGRQQTRTDPAAGNPRLEHRTGTLLGPLLLIPFLVQLDTCVVRKEWYQFNAFALALLVLGSLVIVAIRTYPTEIAAVLRESQALIAGFLFLAVLALFGAMLPEAYLEDGVKFVFYPTADAVLFGLSICVSVMCRRESIWRRTLTAAMGIVVLSIVWDSVYPGTFSELTTRAAGFGVNPNTGGAIVALLLIGALPWDRGGFHPLTLLTLGMAGAGIFLTLSRSALLCWGLVSAAYLLRTLIVRGASSSAVVILAGGPLLIYATTAGEWARNTFPMLQQSHQRIEAFLGGDAMDHADDSRVHLVEEFYEMAMERPWLGWGTGLNYAYEEGAHNIFLARWVENGIAALTALGLLIVGTYRLGSRAHSPEAKVLAAYILAQGFFSHNLLEDKTVLIMWGVVSGRAALRKFRSEESSTESCDRSIALPQGRSRARLAIPMRRDAA